MSETSPASEIAVDIKNVTKKYGEFTALRNVNFDIRDNEFFTLLGPSGCGKTTLLRTIAGFEDISEGEIVLYGENIAGLPPNKRPVNTVFQQYALFPHMNVTRNVMFGLLRMGMDEAAAKARALQVLEMVQLSAFADRMPSQLSGGQQQRVALARALAPSPKVLLLDEPLSALDLKLRQAVRMELSQLQRDTGITFIFVTHDQEEALTMSDRIAVINGGQVQQIGQAREIYEAPENRFVADFIGETNILDVTVSAIENGTAQCNVQGGGTFTCRAAHDAIVGAGHVSVRPERISLCGAGAGLLDGTVLRQTYLGTDVQVEIGLVNGTSISTRLQNSSAVHVPDTGATVGVNFEAGGTRLLVD